MTRDEAITKLTNILNDDTYSWHPAHAEALRMAIEALKVSEVKRDLSDMISRREAIDVMLMAIDYDWEPDYATDRMNDLSSVQPEQRCVNCGRTANNGGWYKDGRTRCPIEEHYALPKDGYCHLWEKRKDWEDDYVKRQEEGEK